MKTKIVFISLILISLNGYTQVNEVELRHCYKQGNIELGFFTNVGKVVRTTISKYDYWDDNSIYQDVYIDFFIGASVDYYIIDRLSIEPELNIINITKTDPSYAIIGNLCYTFFCPSENNYFYVKLGYGWGAKENIDHANNDGYRIINGAIGFKTRISSSFTYRVELNYRSMKSESSNDNISYIISNQNNTNSNSMSISAGINFLF